MNIPWHDLIQRYISGTITNAEAASLEQQLKSDAALRDFYLDAVHLDSALQATAESAELALSLPVPSAQRVLAAPSSPAPRWYSWRPLTAAAAGIVLGMLCTSVVYGFVVQRLGAMTKIPLAVFDPSFEMTEAVKERGVPDQVGEWGADSAWGVPAEQGIPPQEGHRMMRLEPIPKDKNVKNLASRVYQVLDLRSLPPEAKSDDAEVVVTASFYPTNHEVSSRYLIRTFALEEAPHQATQNFWSKSEDNDVVSVAQRFDTISGAPGWHTFSLKMPLPRGAQTLVLILGAVPPEEPSLPPFVHYLDAVQVSLLVPESTLP